MKAHPEDMTATGEGEERATITLSRADLERLIDARADERILAFEVERHKSHLGLLDDATVRSIIEALSPESELGHGKKFLLKLLDRKGVVGVEAFIDKALEAVDEDGKLDYARNFDLDEKAVFDAVRLPKRHGITKRQMWMGLGATVATGFIAESAVDGAVAATGVGKVEEPEEVDPARRMLQQVHRFTADVVAPISLAGIGFHILNDMQIEKARITAEDIAEKVAHIEYALDELADRSKALKSAGGAALGG